MTFSPLGLTPLIQVFDMTTSLAFYRDLLGFTVVSASPEVETAEGRFSHWMWLRSGNVDIMLNTKYDSNERPAQPPKKQPPKQQPTDVAFYIHCSDVDLAFHELTARGLKTQPPEVARYGNKRFDVVDPDGYSVIFQQVRD
jgi:glyoxylase I family protein